MRAETGGRVFLDISCQFLWRGGSGIHVGGRWRGPFASCVPAIVGGTEPVNDMLSVHFGFVGLAVLLWNGVSHRRRRRLFQLRT